MADSVVRCSNCGLEITTGEETTCDFCGQECCYDCVDDHESDCIDNNEELED